MRLEAEKGATAQHPKRSSCFNVKIFKNFSWNAASLRRIIECLRLHGSSHVPFAPFECSRTLVSDSHSSRLFYLERNAFCQALNQWCWINIWQARRWTKNLRDTRSKEGSFLWRQKWQVKVKENLAQPNQCSLYFFELWVKLCSKFQVASSDFASWWHWAACIITT